MHPSGCGKGSGADAQGIAGIQTKSRMASAPPNALLLADHYTIPIREALQSALY
jgi:hypothetical protein